MTASPILPDAYAIIIGAMKCGTTSLYMYLKDHPCICPAITKEPAYFIEGRGVQVNAYEDLWSFEQSVHRYALEATTDYTKYPSEQGVPKRIFDYGIRPKFIYLVRDPFDRITSHYNFMRYRKWWNRSIDDDVLVSQSNYYLQLEQYRQYFPLRDILLLDFDELRACPKKVVSTTLAFLDLSANSLPTTFKVANPNPNVSRLEWNLRQSKYHSSIRQMPTSVKRVGRFLLRRATSPPVKRTLSKSERNRIHARLSKSMAGLRNVYGFPVCKWGFDA